MKTEKEKIQDDFKKMHFLLTQGVRDYRKSIKNSVNTDGQMTDYQFNLKLIREKQPLDIDVR